MSRFKIGDFVKVRGTPLQLYKLNSELLICTGPYRQSCSTDLFQVIETIPIFKIKSVNCDDIVGCYCFSSRLSKVSNIELLSLA